MAFLKETIKTSWASVMQQRRKWMYRNRLTQVLGNNPRLQQPLPANIVKEIDDYWEDFIPVTDKRWHQAYANFNGIVDPRYIPEDIFYPRILPILNHSRIRIAFGDKNLAGQWVPTDIPTPDTILYNIHGRFYDKEYSFLTKSDAQNLLVNFNGVDLVIKPSISPGGGKGLRILWSRDGVLWLKTGVQANLDMLKRLYGRNFIIQRKIGQSRLLADIHPQSINTVRVMTLRLHSQIHVVSSVVRFGVGGSYVDNLGAGGVACGLDNSGALASFAVDARGRAFASHPSSGMPFAGTSLPNISVLHESVKRIHKRVLYCDLASFDFALCANGDWSFIEINLGAQGINLHQFSNGPLFGAHTRAVLKMIFGS